MVGAHQDGDSGDEAALRATIEALRAELERRDGTQADAVQSAVSDAHDEIVQLQATVAMLRSELERQRDDHATALADAERRFRDEREQLQRTVAALRTELESQPAPGAARA